jgi:uncharacterized cupredoxin-like copper-binding protein
LISVAVLIVAAVAGFFLMLQRSEPRTFTVTATDFEFRVNGGEPKISLRMGEEVRIVFENKGQHDHEFLLVKDRGKALEMIKEKLEKGASDEELDRLKNGLAYQGIRFEAESGGVSIFRLRINEAGIFYFVCLETEPEGIPHAELGQVGVIEVG